MGVTTARPDTAKEQALGFFRGLARWRFQIPEKKTRRTRAGKEKLNERQKAC